MKTNEAKQMEKDTFFLINETIPRGGEKDIEEMKEEKTFIS